MLGGDRGVEKWRRRSESRVERIYFFFFEGFFGVRDGFVNAVDGFFEEDRKRYYLVTLVRII